jgi:hypothetical protein
MSIPRPPVVEAASGFLFLPGKALPDAADPA